MFSLVQCIDLGSTTIFWAGHTSMISIKTAAMVQFRRNIAGFCVIKPGKILWGYIDIFLLI